MNNYFLQDICSDRLGFHPSLFFTLILKSNQLVLIYNIVIEYTERKIVISIFQHNNYQVHLKKMLYTQVII